MLSSVTCTACSRPLTHPSSSFISLHWTRGYPQWLSYMRASNDEEPDRRPGTCKCGIPRVSPLVCRICTRDICIIRQELPWSSMLMLMGAQNAEIDAIREGLNAVLNARPLSLLIDYLQCFGGA